MALVRQPGAQMALDVQLRDDATLGNFWAAGDSAPVVDLLATSPSAGAEQMIYLYGTSDSGRTHLLQGACHSAGAGSAYLPLRELKSYEPESVLAGMDRLQRVCVDDLQAVAGCPGWESALFHLINGARASGCQLIVAADASPRRLPVHLPDLQSRLAWGVVFRLATANDEELIAILQHRAVRRGLVLGSDVASYILNRAPRSLSGLMELLERLDRESLTQQRNLSIPFVRSIMQ